MMAIFKKKKERKLSFGEDVEKVEYLYLADGNIKCLATV